MALVTCLGFSMNIPSKEVYRSVLKRGFSNDQWKYRHVTRRFVRGISSHNGYYYSSNSNLRLCLQDFDSCRTGDCRLLSVSPASLYYLPKSRFHNSKVLGYDDSSKPSSKVEQSVRSIGDLQDKEPDQKRPLHKRIQDEFLHYYHGFRLLFIDIKISAKLIYRILNGKSLSRREHKQLIRTTSDVFRLVPFSVFIIVPFMELLLPVFLKLFPGMLPSTFETKNERENKMKAELKVKLDMAKFLQETLDDMALQGKGRSSQDAKNFAAFIDRIRTSGHEVTNDEILKYSKLFEDELTLDALNRPQLLALCRVVDIPALGNTALLRFHLRMRLRYLVADDKVIRNEGVESLDTIELQNACRARGMRAIGVPDTRLQRQLEQWLELSLDKKVPPSLLLLSRAMFLPENLATTAKLQATLSALPTSAALSTKAAIGEKEGKVDNKTRIELLREEERLIRLERQESKKELLLQMKELEKVDLKDFIKRKASIERTLSRLDREVVYTPLAYILGQMKKPTLGPKSVAEIVETTLSRKQMSQSEVTEAQIRMLIAPEDAKKLTAKDFETVEKALAKLSAAKNAMLQETEELDDLKNEMADYVEDLHELETVLKKTEAEGFKVKESKGARRLYRKLNTMISSLENVVQKIGGSENGSGSLVATEELISAVKQIKHTEDPIELEKIIDLLTKLDDDKDGKIDVDDLVKVIEVIGRDNIKMTSKQLEEIFSVLSKEESLVVRTPKSGKAEESPSPNSEEPKTDPKSP